MAVAGRLFTIQITLRIVRMSEQERIEVTHKCPAEGESFTPCCGRNPFELPRTDRMTIDDKLVTCRRRNAGQDCPRCGSECCRDEVDVGVGVMIGPWGCACGWSEDSRYDLSDGKSPVRDGGVIDSRGGWTRLPSG